MKNKENLQEVMLKYFGDTGEVIKKVQAPGRVNLIGEHTDYNDGFVLPIAIDREITIVGQKRNDREVRVYSLDYDCEESFNLDSIEYNAEQIWINYVQGVAKVLMDAGYELNGMNLLLTGNVPQGAGLSSSAALEVAMATICEALSDFTLEGVEKPKLCRKAENEFVGVNCGIMDQFISALGEKDNALFIDCRSHEYKLIPIETSDIKIVVSNTNVEHSLVDSAYNQRLAECAEAVEVFNRVLDREIVALRDVTVAEFEENKGELSEVVRKRAEHVINENNRVEETIEAFKNSDIARVGVLMQESHFSLRDLYEVSCEELDILVDLALEVDGVYGSRMTGAGFGGCTVSLVREDAVDAFVESVSRAYKEKTGIETDIYVCSIEDGARVL